MATMNNPSGSKADVLARAEQNHIKFIDLQFTDVVGVVKNVTIPAHELPAALEDGIWFDGSSIEGFARVAESDMHLRPDPATFALIPWLTGDEATARLICDVYTPDGQPFPGDPRSILRSVIDDAAQMGFRYNTGPELEFFLLKPHPDGSLIPPIPVDSASYFDAPSDMSAGLRRQMANTLEALGLQVEAMHHEGAHGQQEIDFRYSDALTTADSAVTLRVALKVIAQQNGLYCTFLPKPIRGINGSGMHVHQSLTYVANGMNAFSDPGDAHGLSKIAKHFIAGQLAHARGMCAITNPLVNSYKRLVPGYEAPVNVAWSMRNRSPLIRVPDRRGLGTRVELRMPDPAANPYLALAAMLAGGLDGIETEADYREPVNENIWEMSHREKRRLRINGLPHDLNKALDELVQDDVITGVLGKHITTHFVEAKRQEWRDYITQVSAWELESYLAKY